MGSQPKSWRTFLAGFLLGGIAVYGAMRFGSGQEIHGAMQQPAVCYSCFWEGYDPKLRSDLVEYFRQFRNPDALVNADAAYVLWRLTGTPNCDLRGAYKSIGDSDGDSQRRYVAESVLAFGAEECGVNPKKSFVAAADAAQQTGLTSEANLLRQMAGGKLNPQFVKTAIHTDLQVPPGATTIILGASRVDVLSSTHVLAQTDRVARDWISNQFRWDLSSKPLADALGYHEGAVISAILKGVSAPVHAAIGSIAAKQGDTWYASDENGAFRFAVLPDKILYPTTHVMRNLAWVEDTHGISAMVPFALETHAQLVIGCGDAEGKAEAAYYLAQHGIHVMFPGDRYQDLLLGYTGSGTLIGGAPVKQLADRIVLGDQPIKISMTEPIVVEDTQKAFPIQYYDSGARYFRRLAKFVPQLQPKYFLVNGPEDLSSLLESARKSQAHVVGVRVATEGESIILRNWLGESAKNRAILFHSGLYPFAQPLFHDFPTQVTFGDLRPRFE